MSNQKDLKQPELATIVLDNARYFTESTSKILSSIFGVSVDGTSAPVECQSHRIEKGYFASILFIGSAFGEFILCAPESTLRSIFPEVTEEDSLQDTLAEALNIVVGQCLPHLSRTFDKITMTAPRTGSGNIKLPDVRAYQATIETAGGPVTCLIYVDQMKLDLATSYKEVVHTLSEANQELKTDQ